VCVCVCVYILVIHPFALAMTTTLLNLPSFLTTLNPVFAEKAQSRGMFSFGAFRHSQRDAPPFDPLTPYSVLTSISSLVRGVFPSFPFSPGLLFRLVGEKAVVSQIDLRWITVLHRGGGPISFYSVFVEGFSNTHTHTHTRI